MLLHKMKIGDSFVSASKVDVESLVKALRAQFKNDIKELNAQPFDGAAILDVTWKNFSPPQRVVDCAFYPDKVAGSAPFHVKAHLDALIKKLGLENKVRYREPEIHAKASEIQDILTALNSSGSMGGKYPIGNKELTEKVKKLESENKIKYDKHYDKWVKASKVKEHAEAPPMTAKALHEFIQSKPDKKEAAQKFDEMKSWYIENSHLITVGEDVAFKKYIGELQRYSQ